MKIKIKLFSILRQYVRDYDPEFGVVVTLNAQTTVQDLIRHLNIPEEKRPVVTCNGRILKPNDVLMDGSELNIFQPVAGG